MSVYEVIFGNVSLYREYIIQQNETQNSLTSINIFDSKETLFNVTDYVTISFCKALSIISFQFSCKSKIRREQGTSFTWNSG